MPRFLLILLLVSSNANPQDAPEKKAAEFVKQAEALAAKGSFEQARALYLLIVKKYATTKVSTVAAYRAGDNALIGWDLMHEGGSWRNRVNVHFMGDSFLYTDQDQRSFGGLAKSNMQAMFEEPAFKEFMQGRQRVTKISREASTLEVYLPVTDKVATRILVSLKSIADRVAEESVGGTGFAVLVDQKGEPLFYPLAYLGVEAVQKVALDPAQPQAR